MEQSTLTTEEAVAATALGVGFTTDPASWADNAEALAFVERLHSLGWKLVEIESEPLPDVAHARRGDPATSEIAAASIGDMKELHRAVLQVAQTFDGPFTYDDLIARYETRRANDLRVGTPDGGFRWDLPKMTPSSIRSRAKALNRAGWIVNTGERGVSDAGGTAILWRAVR
jgi:hypothetical protein